jgi:hypothetical protein
MSRKIGGRTRPTMTVGSVGLLVLVGSLFLNGCASSGPHLGERFASPAGPQVSKEDLRAALDEFEDFFDATINQACSDLDERLPGPDARRNTLLWRVRMMPACRAALRREDPIKAFIEEWTLSLRMTQFFEEGEGRTMFGEHQAIAVSAAKEIENDIERVGRLFLSEERLTKAREDARTFARTHPIRGQFVGAVIRMNAASAETPSGLAALLHVPLAPFTAMQGIDHTAAAIRSFTSVADRFTDIVEEFPESTRWQMELMLLEMERGGVVKAGLTSFEQFSDSTASLSRTAEGLPQEVETRASRLLDQIDAKQAGLQTTVSQVDEAVANVDRALQRVEAASISLDGTAKSVAEAGRAWEATAVAVGATIRDVSGGPSEKTSAPEAATPASAPVGPPSEPAQTPSGDPLKDYRDTADALTTTATELRMLAVEIRGLLRPPGVGELVDRTATQTREVTDHLSWRGAELVLLVFVLALAYRLLAARWSPRQARGA